MKYTILDFWTNEFIGLKDIDTIEDVYIKFDANCFMVRDNQCKDASVEDIKYWFQDSSLITDEIAKEISKCEHQIEIAPNKYGKTGVDV